MLAGDYSLLVRALPVSRHIHLQRRRPSIVEKIHANAGLAAAIGRQQRAVEVWQKVDGGAIIGRICREDARHRYTDIGLCVVSDDCCVDDKCDQSLLVGGIVFFQKGGGVIVALGLVSNTKLRG